MVLAEILRVKGRKVITARPEDTLLEAAKKLTALNVGALVIVDGNGGLRGIFTERDVLHITARECPCNFGEMILADYMTTDLVKAHSSATIEDCLAVMTERHIRHLPVVDEGRLVGIISQGDLVKASLERAEFETVQLTNFVMGKYPA